ncbi:MAG: PD-(D/E)XK nuclease family protein [Anaeromyxobacteraceae bacterium]
MAALPAGGPLPVRTAIVSSERQAHALRRELVRSGQGAVLGGTRFVGAGTLAREILEDAGVPFTPGEEGLRPARILALLEDDLPLEHFDLELLRSTPGWPEALAGAVSDLEGAGLDPARLPTGSAQWRDVGRLWTLLDAAAGASFTGARIFREATARLRAGAALAGGPVLAPVTGRESAVQAAFLTALPGARLAVVAARPLRARHLERVERLFGPDARRALETAPLPTGSATDRDVLLRHLFAPADVLADPARPRGAGKDGTVELSEHSGVEAELEAAAEWVAREVLERKTPLEDVAVLVPAHAPLAALVAARLSRLPWQGGPFPVHVAGGLPLSATAGGARALAVVRALRAFLPAEGLAAVLPSLAVKAGDRDHLQVGEATEIAWSVASVGGNHASREGALEWPLRFAERETQLAATIAAFTPDDEEREGRRRRRELDRLRAVLPAVAALSSVARLVVEDRPLAEIGPALCAFLAGWLRDPTKGTKVHELLAEDLEGARGDAVGAHVAGVDALAVVEERILARSLPTVRFGSPAVYVGTLAGAAGLGFEAVRILGLAEGALPSAAREDAVLPDRLREEAGPLVPLSGDRAVAQLHAFDAALRAARSRIALSVPHSDMERSDRETSSLLIDVGAALGRPDPEARQVVPDLQSLGRTSFGRAREETDAFRSANPVTQAQRLDLAAGTSAVDPAWATERQLDLGRILALQAREGIGPSDGILGAKGPFPTLPGLSPDRPISASALETLVGCPLRFLYQRILGWDEPAGPATVRELDPLSYGSLFHEVAETFYRAHGEAFVAHQGTLAGWKKKARALAAEAFDALRVGRPLVGKGVEEKERARLLRDVDSFLEYDWKRPLTRFVGVELPFRGLTLDAGTGKLHVHGYIDRVDVEGDHTVVRDLKSGRDHPRAGEEAEPTPTRDVQLGLYGLVARRKAAEWGVPRKLQAAYVYPRNGAERDFRADHADLEAATKEWLAVSHDLLAERSFPPTPVSDDCTFCPFAVICDGSGRAAAAVDDSEGAVAAFFAMKTGVEKDGE